MYEQTIGLNTGQKTLSSRVAIALLLLVALSYVTNAMDRSLYPQLVPYINKHFGFSLSEGGFLSTIFALGMGIGGIPAGFLIDKMSRKSVTILGIFIYSLFTLLNAYSNSFWDLASYRVLTGIGEALQQTALFAMVGAYFYRYRTVAIGSLNAAYGIGAFLGPVLGMQLFLRTGEYWQTPLIAFGGIGLVFCVVFQSFVPKLFSEAKGIASAVRHRQIESHLPKRLLTKNVVLVSIANVMTGLSTFGYLGLYPTFLKTSLHFSTSNTALCASMYGVGAFMGLPAGFIGDKLNQKRVIILAALGSMVVYLFMFNVAQTPSMQALLSFLQGVCASGFLFVNIYSLTQRSVRNDFLGRASGIASSAHYLPAAFSGMLLGWMVGHLDWGFAAIIQLAIFPLIAISAMLMFDSKLTSRVERHDAVAENTVSE
ncbi:MAG: transporter [Herbaspirillum sp.]|jgi:MFS family permease|nr:transporter [Herbaspirillum sp.]